MTCTVVLFLHMFKELFYFVHSTYKTGYQISKTYNIRAEIPGPLGEYRKTKSNPMPLKIIPQYYISYNLQGWILAKNRAKGQNLTPSNPLNCKNLTPKNPVISMVLTIFFQNLTLFRKLFQKNKKRHFLNLKNFFFPKRVRFSDPKLRNPVIPRVFTFFRGLDLGLDFYIEGWIFRM